MARTVRRRRREFRTDYKTRLALLKSGKPRLVVRKSNQSVTAQIVLTEGAQDKVVTTVTSRDLLGKGWPESRKGSLKNLAASYLTGFLIGKRVKNTFPEVILDMGMHRNVHGSRLYAFVKGVHDSGLVFPHSESVFPSSERIELSAKDIDIKKIKEKL